MQKPVIYVRRLPESMYTKTGEISSNCIRETWILKNESELYKNIINHSIYIEGLSFHERLFLYICDLKEIPRCAKSDCNKQLKYKGKLRK